MQKNLGKFFKKEPEFSQWVINLVQTMQFYYPLIHLTFVATL